MNKIKVMTVVGTRPEITEIQQCLKYVLYDRLGYECRSKAMLNNKSILITGGTGSFGKKFTKLTLENYNPKK